MDNLAYSILEKNSQTHILDRIKKTSNQNNLKQLSDQILSLEKTYPGGISEYISRAKKLLNDSKNNVNPYQDFTPSVPKGVEIEVGNEAFHEYEKIGLEALASAGFVLVAGGLGERLGYPGIKIGIVMDLLTRKSFIEHYAGYLLAYEARLKAKLKKDVVIPLCIMTSDDTHEQTTTLLKENKNFGLRDVTIVKQEKVPALLNNDCHIALKEELSSTKKDDKEDIDNKEGQEEKETIPLLETKPHGHGDVHTLLYQHQVVERWVKQGIKHIIFFQDTNALTFKAVPSLLGVSVSEKLIVNTLSIPRKPGDALGAICSLTDSNRTITLNVEYNQIDALLKSKYNPKGDTANSKGLSDFPGNINILVFETSSYLETLQLTKGLVPEFVNPKYADEGKSIFKSPTRLECMMQDYPLLLTKNEKVGFTMFPVWFAFASCKNNLTDSLVRLEKGLSPENGFSIEQALFAFHLKVLQLLGKVKLLDSVSEKVRVLGCCDVEFGPKIISVPGFAVTLREFDMKIKGVVSLTSRSSLVLWDDAEIPGDVLVDGALHVKGVLLEKEWMKKDYISYVPLAEGEGEMFEQIRGYKVKN